MLLLGLVGATGAGKSALSDRLVASNSYQRLHMGQPIKDMLACLGLSHEELNGPPIKRSAPSALLSGQSPRYAMQTLGTDWGRRLISRTIWADALDRRLGDLIAAGSDKIVIDDLRFPEDFAVVVRRGGIIGRVVRPGVSRRLRGIDHLAHAWPKSARLLNAVGIRPLHETEYHWREAPSSFDILNDRTIDEAHAALVDALATKSLAKIPLEDQL